MMPFSLTFISSLSAFFRSRYSLCLEILAPRRQLCVLKRRNPRPWLRIQDRVFWILLRGLWPAWDNVLLIVKPQTVVAWHRAGFRLFWCLRSRAKQLGRPKIDAEVRIHDSLEKDAPAMRPVSPKPEQAVRLVSFPRIGGLHHRYDWQKAAGRGLGVDAEPIEFRGNRCLTLLRTHKLSSFPTLLPGVPALQHSGNS